MAPISSSQFISTTVCMSNFVTDTHTHTHTHTHTKYGFLWTFNTCVDSLRFMHHCSAAADLTCEDQKELQECGVRLRTAISKMGPVGLVRPLYLSNASRYLISET